MNFLTLPYHRSRTSRRATRVTFRPTLDGLESRTVLSAAVTAAAHVAKPPAHIEANSRAAEALNLRVTGLAINNVANQAGTLVASGLATVSVAGHAVNNVPVSLTSTAPTAGALPILHLSLGPVNLSLLGLNVKLDNCNNGPVTVDLKAIPSSQPGGGLLGDLLGGVANLLNPSGLSPTTPVPTNLAGQVNSLMHARGNTVLNGLNNVLTGVTNGLATSAAAAAGSTTTQVLDLHLNPINLNLLGAQVTTSAICLGVTATPGAGNLLGNLLSNISHLLGTNGQAGVAAQLNNVLHVAQQARPLGKA